MINNWRLSSHRYSGVTLPYKYRDKHKCEHSDYIHDRNNISNSDIIVIFYKCRMSILIFAWNKLYIFFYTLVSYGLFLDVYNLDTCETFSWPYSHLKGKHICDLVRYIHLMDKYIHYEQGRHPLFTYN